MKTYSKEEKKEYFSSLRKQWEATKELSESEQIRVAFEASGISISIRGFSLIYAQMQEQGLEGLPVIDAKTFLGWKEAGFKVMKGQKSTLHGITWINASREEGEEDKNSFVFPKIYHLFHRSQVVEI